MKILHKYLARELLVAFGLGMLVFTFVLLAGRILPDVLPLLSQRVPIPLLLNYFALLIPYLLVFSIPMAMLTATLLVFGKLSADNEITAIRASGMSLLNLISPAIVIAIGLVFVCLLINCYIAPMAKFSRKSMLLEVGMRDPAALVEEGSYTTLFPGYLLYTARRESNVLHQINAFSLDERGRPTQNFRADRAILSVNGDTKVLTLELFNVRGEVRDPDDPMNLKKVRRGLQAERYPMQFDLGKVLKEARQKRETGEMSFTELLRSIHDLRSKGITPTPLWMEAHRRVSGAFACFAFVLIGIPLGIKAQRRETSIGVGMGLLLVFVYYVFVVLAKTFENKPQYYPELFLWAPNIAFEVLGLFLLWRVSRR